MIYKVILSLLLLFYQFVSSKENNLLIKKKDIEDIEDVINEKFPTFDESINAVFETPSIVPTPDSFVSYSPTLAPSTPSPSRKPTIKPTAPKPTQKPTPGVYIDHPDIYISEEDQQTIVGVLTLLLFVFMALEILSPEVLFLIALIIIMLCQILSLSETLSGFANESMITIGTLFLVIGAVEKSHIVDYVARKTFGMVGSITLAKIRMYITCFCLSIFFNNTPLVAILLPVVKDWGRVRNVAASQLLIPLSYSVLAGSFVSMIGTSTNLTVQGLMQADRGYSFHFFAPAPIGIPLFAILLVYQVLFGHFLLPHHKSGLIRAVRDHVESLVAEVYVSPDSKFIGQNLELMMNSLGIAPSRVIKIRRRTTPRTEEEIKADQKQRLVRDKSIRKELKKRSNSTVLDRNYLKQFLPFWKTQSADAGAEAKQQDENNDNNNINNRDSTTKAYEAANVDDVDIEESSKLNGEFRDIIAPSSMEILSAEDIVFISSAQDVVEKLMKSIAGESKGLYIVESNVLSLPGYGSEIVECVVSDTNPFLGKKVSEIASLFSERYKFGFITIRSKNWGNTDDDSSTSQNEENKDQDSSSLSKLEKKDKQVDNNDTNGIELKITKIEEGDGVTLTEEAEPETIQAQKSNTELLFERITSQSVSEHVIHYGDLILCVANSEDIAKARSTSDFYVISTVGQLPQPLDLWKSIAVVIFLVMMILVATENIDMCPAALTVTCVFFIGGWIKYDEIPKLIDIRLLMLMGCSLSFARSMTKTGLALRIAESIYDSDPSPFESCLLIYAITLVITELISNNAAAALMYPIAVALADELDVSFIPFAMTVLVASTAGFMSPIGYQTHVMVWGPGGYKFKDFLIFGLVPDVIYWIIGCALIVRIYPFDEYP